MGTTLTADVFEDAIAVSLARAMAVANKRARELGIDVLQSLITVTQRAFDDDMFWQINYGPKDYIGRSVAVGRHDDKLVIIPYEADENSITPVTIHVTTRQQIASRIRTGRF